MTAHAPRRRIVATGLEVASRSGLQALSLGEMARVLEMPKSGVSSEFASTDQLQLAVLEEAASLFATDVVDAANIAPAGEPRLAALFRKWLAWSRAPRFAGGCPFFHASRDNQSLPPPLRAKLRELLDMWSAVLRAEIEVARGQTLHGELDAHQLVFELYGLYLSHHVWHWSMGDSSAFQRTITAYDRLIAGSRLPVAA